MVVVVLIVVVVVIVRSLTGTVGPHSTAGLTVVAATALSSARLDQVVAHDELQFGRERSVVLAEVAERSSETRFVGHRVIVGRVIARPLPRSRGLRSPHGRRGRASRRARRA